MKQLTWIPLYSGFSKSVQVLVHYRMMIHHESGVLLLYLLQLKHPPHPCIGQLSIYSQLFPYSLNAILPLMLMKWDSLLPGLVLDLCPGHLPYLLFCQLSVLSDLLFYMYFHHYHYQHCYHIHHQNLIHHSPLYFQQPIYLFHLFPHVSNHYASALRTHPLHLYLLSTSCLLHYKPSKCYTF